MTETPYQQTRPHEKIVAVSTYFDSSC